MTSNLCEKNVLWQQPEIDGLAKVDKLESWGQVLEHFVCRLGGLVGQGDALQEEVVRLDVGVQDLCLVQCVHHTQHLNGEVDCHRLDTRLLHSTSLRDVDDVQHASQLLKR